MRTRSLAVLLLLLQAGTVTGQNLGTDAVLTRAMRYAEDYQRALSAIVGEERQTQREIRADGSIKRQRDLVADILLVKSAQRLVIFRRILDSLMLPIWVLHPKDMPLRGC